MKSREFENTAPLLSRQEELARTEEAARRFREKAKNDPEYGRRFLEKIGYRASDSAPIEKSEHPK